MKRLQSPIFAIIILVLAAACAPLKMYRTDLSVCESAAPENDCRRNALQFHRDPAHPQQNYLLAFIEFDDQGQLFDRRQMDAVLTTLYEQAASQDLLITVFVHGWKHSAAPSDDNIRLFRRTLSRLSELETALSQQTGLPPRRVIGIYLGWRGASITFPVIKELTFWDRKNTAHKVGNGGVTEVLNRIDLVRRTKLATEQGQERRTRLIIVGHSFGGAVVFSALHQILNDRFVRTLGPDGQVSDVRGYGDLIVLLNPAFEALRYTPLSDMSTERGSYFPSQLPVLAILTSEADLATGMAFPLGRFFSTLFEKERDIRRFNAVTRKVETIDESEANRTAVGHFNPYRTHRLRAKETGRPPEVSVQSDMALFKITSTGWKQDHPGGQIDFGESVLERNPKSAGRNPYLVILVDGKLIPNHNDIDDPRIARFIRQLIMISSH